MQEYQPAPGTLKEALDTPIILLELEALEHNVRTMGEFFRDKPAKLRPHMKTHKTPVLAYQQLAAGAVGVCCAKLGEAEIMGAAGIRDIFIVNQILGPVKIARLMSLATYTDVAVAVDDPDNVRALSNAAQDWGVSLRVLVDVNTGMNRCGVLPGGPVVDLARLVADLPGLRLSGVTGYEGHLVFITSRAEREAKARESMRQLVESAEAVRAVGLPCPTVTAGGTGTYDISGSYPGVTEIQAGSYITMDARYRDVGVPFKCALTVLASVISRPVPERLIIDVGMKAISHEFGLPEVVGLPGASIKGLSEEHGTIVLEDPGAVKLRPGDKLELLPTHGDTTINLHERYFALRGGRLEAIWPIAARGRSR